jgi:hypothetical protein
MPSLSELQGDFAAAMFAGGDAALAAHCGGSPTQVAQGIAAYRQSVRHNLAAAVEATYPLLALIVGPAFLAEAARQYVLLTPSRSGDLNAYGDAFDRFLAAYPPAAELPYLADVACLEWQVQQVYAAPEPAPADLASLAATPPEAWASLRFVLDAAHARLASPWPLARIWAVNQADYADDPRVDFSIGEEVLIQRRSGGTVVELLAPGEYALLEALAADQTLGAAVAAAQASAAAFDLPTALQRFLANGVLRGAVPAKEIAP